MVAASQFTIFMAFGSLGSTMGALFFPFLLDHFGLVGVSIAIALSSFAGVLALHGMRSVSAANSDLV